ncbi:hypothetical protein CC78DRAFT_585784 [Lojkania enalia]|uniref:Uncharacterized protein n=1 Tax=Lojkania enalia TaxID=147567 RepID=A0A9P4N2C4_9PLEO|nr:hypothetical protein CC78DRAFT_585784 [Didymosphaeria enalia]
MAGSGAAESQEIKGFLLDSSKGLVEITTFNTQKAQFHSRIGKGFSSEKHGLGSFWLNIAKNLQGQSHERLKQCCLIYISIDFFQRSRNSENHSQASSQEAADICRSATSAFPFQEYAVSNVLCHADIAVEHGIAQEILQSF